MKFDSQDIRVMPLGSKQHNLLKDGC